MVTKPCRLALILATVTGWSTPVLAGQLDAVGSRAAGLTAFVAVADDATAVAWNPAGLVLGPIFNVSVDLGRFTHSTNDRPEFPARAGRVGARLVAIGVPPVGLSYYRIRSTAFETPSPAGPPDLDRQNRQVVLRALLTSHVGVTVLQSIGDYMTVGATAKLVRGSVGAGLLSVDTWEEAFDRAEAFDAPGSTTGDLDIGVMFAAGRVRAGLVVRNVTEPQFKAVGGETVALDRHARVGVAWGDAWPGLAQTIVAIDADTTRVPHAAGERRDVGAGVERWFRGRRLGVRGGLRVSTLGDARPIASGGVSYAVGARTSIDAYVAEGRHVDRAWGVGARLTY